MSQTGVNIFFDDKVLSSAPKCKHGPTLLFERKNSQKERYYACSACRDRKDCSFFMWESEYERRLKNSIPMPTFVVSENNDKKGVEQSDDTFIDRGKEIMDLPVNRRRFCRTCSILLLPNEFRDHEKHEFINLINKHNLSRPTLLFEPIKNKKKEAQYFYSENTAQFFMSTIKSLRFTHILCIGCPRIHENICSEEKPVLESFLLDIDDRFRNFYPCSRFSRYNMFNHHFFNDSGVENPKKDYEKFLQDSKSLLIIVDPPFGGLISPLAHTITTIKRAYREIKNKNARFIWTCPYFMEKKMLEIIPNIAMLDYKIDYENHRLFTMKTINGAMKSKSPIRIFTDIFPQKICLPQSEGYRFCRKCLWYVAEENKHCKECARCTTKHGNTYRHCSDCGICVKPNYIHCKKCTYCHLPDNCQQTKNDNDGVSPTEVGCFTCGDKSHKRRQCHTFRKSQRKRQKK